MKIKIFGFMLQLIAVYFAIHGFTALAGEQEWYTKVGFAVLMWAVIDFGCGFQRVKK